MLASYLRMAHFRSTAIKLFFLSFVFFRVIVRDSLALCLVSNKKLMPHASASLASLPRALFTLRTLYYCCSVSSSEAGVD